MIVRHSVFQADLHPQKGLSFLFPLHALPTDSTNLVGGRSYSPDRCAHQFTQSNQPVQFSHPAPPYLAAAQGASTPCPTPMPTNVPTAYPRVATSTPGTSDDPHPLAAAMPATVEGAGGWSGRGGEGGRGGGR